MTTFQVLMSKVTGEFPEPVTRMAVFDTRVQALTTAKEWSACQAVADGTARVKVLAVYP
ncbi:hypothetical protein R8Z50_02855 [Longispora sp. K20-0274]|uniref:hypothetical protein n=1 Tax=Longispora sp. K20-0274 TaxID=3088255 RepID=UPI003999DFDF